ncbi:MAG TPA: glycosyltransferase family 2 protein [Metabacillus sp.]|nr:glycosyltransferase family 2 protein [Metabacillus sp.]
MGSELISVVIPTYNRGDLLRRSINSVLNQTYTNLELIIVDDASTDNTKEIVFSYKDDRIKYYRLDINTQGTKPRNLGILKSNGKYIALLDSDDEWVPTKLEKQVEFIKGFNEDNIVCFTDLIIKEDEKITYSTNKKLKEGEDIIDYMFVNNTNTWVQASTYLFSSSIGKKTLFDSSLKKHQDIDFCLRLRKNGAMFVQLQEPLTIYHHDRREGRVGNNNKYHLSLEWAAKVKNDLSIKAYYCFMIMFVVNHLIFNSQKFKALKIYFFSYLNKSITLNMFIKGLIKCIIPNKLLIYIYRKNGTSFI